jgi:hypothetical protein
VIVRWAAIAGMTVVAVGLVSVWLGGGFTAGAGGEDGGLAAPQTEAVTRQTLSEQMTVDATLGYGGTYPVLGHTGTLTWVPVPGQVIRQGQVLYRVDSGDPVVLMYGSVPAWRTLSSGVSGADVSQLNHDLAALGDASSTQLAQAGWDDFSAATQSGLGKLGVSGTLGSVVFEPGALRIATVTGVLGESADGPVLTATSTQHVVTVALDAADQSEVAVGDSAAVTLPDGSVASGAVAEVGTVATAPSGPASNGLSQDATIPVTITLTDPAAAGTLDQAPVTVTISTGSVSDVLVVPVSALLAQSAGGYAVEVAGPGSARRLVAVTTGVFDDSSGLVQVTGPLSPGEQVVVPSI